MPLVLSIRASRTLAILLALLALSCALFSFRSLRADSLFRSGAPDDLNRAVNLESENAEYWRQLGLLRLYGQNDIPGSLLALRRATELNPRDADSWIGEAYAYEYIEDPSHERQALKGALAAEPKRPETIWQSANLYAVLGDRRAAMAQLCIIVEHDRTRADAAVQLARRMSPAADAKAFSCGSPKRAP